LVDSCARFHTVHDWHIDIQHDQVEVAHFERVDYLDRLESVLSCGHIEKRLQQKTAGHQSKLVIIYKQESWFRGL
jgi:hypothetical protein